MRVFAPAIVAATLLTACLGSAPPPSATPAEAVRPSPSASPAPSAKLPLGGTLRVALAGPIGSLDPQAGEPNALVVGQLFEGLVARGRNGVVPALATKWLVGADGRRWTFTIRDGVTFHDGTPLDATAAAKSLTRKDDPIVEQAEAIDARTLALTTRVPYGPLLSALGTPPYLIVSPASRTSGTGPFRLPAAGEGARPLVLERNERYWRSDAGGLKLPYLDRLSFTTVADPGARLASIRAGNVDLVEDLALGDLPTVRTDPNLQVVGRPESTVLYLGLNLSLPPIDDLRVRQALAQAVNGRNVVDRAYGGVARAASQLLPPAMLGYDESLMEFAKNDPAAAKKLLADSGHANLEVDLWYVLDGSPVLPDMRRVAETVAADLAAAGIVADLKTIDPITFAVNVRENRYPMWLGFAGAPLFDPDDLLGSAFIPPVVNGQDQPTAAGAWTSKEAAGLLRKARGEPDQSKRAELYKQVSKLAQREIPRIPIAWSAPPAAATRKVLNASGAFFVDLALGK